MAHWLDKYNDGRTYILWRKRGVLSHVCAIIISADPKQYEVCEERDAFYLKDRTITESEFFDSYQELLAQYRWIRERDFDVWLNNEILVSDKE